MKALPDGPWSVAQGEYNGRPLFVRINTGAASVARSPALRHRLGIAVPLQQPDADGLPMSAEAKTLEAIEDALSEGLRVGNEAILVAVITTSGFREFVYHTLATGSVGAIVTSVQGRFVDHELQLIEQDDPEWDVYGQFAGDTAS